ncbi:squalene synthase HpnC [Anatilimnocola floriformis]|uniref:squalene synthase HpnC n=1 Tax=Anatilimnocola floriformis TaxID=2948575 RepID=UPI0020C2CD82|nr:squalene synthase HpnC [Anatilimnocola floriformis]
MDLAAKLAQWGPSGNASRPSLADAEAYCRRLATTHYENFSVVSWLFPRHLHQHLCNVYAYCRWADDLADEIDSPAHALCLLDWWETQLDEPESRHPVFVALQETIRQKQLPLQPLRNLLIAFRQDQQQQRYGNWEELRGYCRKSADPVGRIVLHLGASATAENEAFSDSICTGLQLINFCQDVRRDLEKHRIYLPRDERESFGWDDERCYQFAALKPRQPAPDSFRQLLKVQVERAEQMLHAGEPLLKKVHRDLRLPVRLFIGGGLAIAGAIRQQRYDVWSRRPVVSKLRKLLLLASAWWRG